MTDRKIHACLVHNTTNEEQERNEGAMKIGMKQIERGEQMPIVCEDVSAEPPYMGSYFL